jgi:CBS domain-containing protein
MQARDLMTRPVVTFRADTPIRHAAAVLTDKRIAAAPVVNDEDDVIGMVSEGDLITSRFPPDPRSHPNGYGAALELVPPRTVAEVMTATVVAMSASADAADLAQAMVDYDIRSIPIVSGSTLIGIVSRGDLLRTLVRDDDIIRIEVVNRLDTHTDGPGRWDIQVHDGQVQILGDAGDDLEARVLLTLARTVPGVAHAEFQTRDPTASEAATSAAG